MQIQATRSTRPKELQSFQRKAYLFIILGVICLGTGPIFVKFVQATGSLVAFYRLFFAAMLLTAPVLSHNQKNHISLSNESVRWAVLGGIAFAANISLWCTALTLTTASNVTLLDNTAPIWVGLLGWLFLGKKEGWMYWIGLTITFLGVGLLINISSFQINSSQGNGIILGMFSGFTYATYLLLTRKVRGQMDSITYSWLLALSGAILLLLVNFIFGYFTETLSLVDLLLIMLTAIISQIAGWILINYALGILPVANASVILIGQPIITTLLGIIMLNEVPNLIQAIGGIICLAGIWMVQKSNSV